MFDKIDAMILFIYHDDDEIVESLLRKYVPFHSNTKRRCEKLLDGNTADYMIKLYEFIKYDQWRI